MQRMRQTVLGLVIGIAIVGTVALLGCSEDIQPAVQEDLNNRSFTFANGIIFHPALANMPTALSFTNNSTNFTLSSTSGTAVGTDSLNPCVLTVTFSTYASSAGPQANDIVRLEPCDFDTASQTLIVGNGTTSQISAPGVLLGN